jgi:hypothetical protein
MMFGRERLGMRVGLALASVVALVGCGDKRAPAAALEGPCKYTSLGQVCQTAGGAPTDDDEPVLELECDLPPAGQALRDEVWDPTPQAEQPETCEEAVASKSYVGCEFWPTVTANEVAYIFDFAVVVANTGALPAEVVVERNAEEFARVTVDPNSLQKIFLPWVDALKVGLNECEDSGLLAAQSVRLAHGAYHLTSDRPVVAYQFNPFEFDTAGGPPDKDWKDCKRSSYSNDASLLLPVQALGTSYRGMTFSSVGGIPSFPTLSVTGTADATTVTVYAPQNYDIAAGVGVPPIPKGGKHDFTLNAGDVLQLSSTNFSLAGALIESDRPVQVISGHFCATVPANVFACDHLEETLPPAQALGRRYLVAPPTGPEGLPIPYAVTFQGNQDDTQLFYPGGKPQGAPETLQAGDSVFIANVSEKFEVLATHELGLLLFLQGGGTIDNYSTDPSQSISVPLQQYRRRYVFLAANDYLVNYADVIAPSGAKVMLDGKEVTVEREQFSCTSYEVIRVWLDQSGDGIHVLEASEPVSVQVLGHALTTSYMYPGGLNFSEISEAPPRPVVK